MLHILTFLILYITFCFPFLPYLSTDQGLCPITFRALQLVRSVKLHIVQKMFWNVRVYVNIAYSVKFAINRD